MASLESMIAQAKDEGEFVDLIYSSADKNFTINTIFSVSRSQCLTEPGREGEFAEGVGQALRAVWSKENRL